MDITLNMTSNWMLLQQTEFENEFKTIGGIIVNNSSKKMGANIMAHVLAIGPGAIHKSKKFIVPTQCKVGDNVAIHRSCLRSRYNIRGVEYLIVREDEVLWIDKGET